jgi:hypothetical protein
MARLRTFEIRSLTRLPVSMTESRVEMNVSSDPVVETADESVAFSVLVRHEPDASLTKLQSTAIRRAIDILTARQSDDAS